MNDFSDFTTEDHIIINMHRIARHAMSRMDHALEDIGLSAAKMLALIPLVEADEPMGVTRVAACIRSGKSNATQIIDRLEADGLVRRIPDPADRRKVLVQVTEEGLRRVEQAKQLRRNVSDSLLAALSPAERDHLLAVLERMVSDVVETDTS